MQPPATSNVDHKLLQGNADDGARHGVHRRCPAECGPRVELAKAKTLVAAELVGLFCAMVSTRPLSLAGIMAQCPRAKHVSFQHDNSCFTRAYGWISVAT